MVLAAFALLAIGAVLAACSARPDRTVSVPGPGDVAPLVRVVETSRPLECVPYARSQSRIDLKGDAWTWWNAAEGRYDRGNTPEPGAVLVLKRQGGMRGHLAVVTGVGGNRVVVANHANWLNEGRIFENTPIMDVSEAGDWSAVRVWYPPGRTWGKRVYAAHGFIYGGRQRAQLR